MPKHIGKPPPKRNPLPNQIRIFGIITHIPILAEVPHLHHKRAYPLRLSLPNKASPQQEIDYMGRCPQSFGPINQSRPMVTSPLKSPPASHIGQWPPPHRPSLPHRLQILFVQMVIPFHKHHIRPGQNQSDNYQINPMPQHARRHQIHHPQRNHQL